MKHLTVLIVIILIIQACQPEEELVDTSSSLQLKISTDTVLFDTLLTDRGSLTKRFKIYNPNESAIRLDDIRLGNGPSSSYKLIINGRKTHSIQNEVLFGKDSLQILIHVEIDPLDVNTPYLVKDSVVFDWNGNSNHVKLVAWGQDAIYINADTLCNVIWTADRPYVIFNYAYVEAGCDLIIDPGAKVFIDNEAGFLVGGSLKMLGNKDERITIRNTRLDYKYAPGQWDGIYFLPGSSGNEVRYTDISNGTIGLYLGTPDEDDIFDLIISNTTIGHMSRAGILAFTSELIATNTVVYNCGQYVVGNFAGGTYQYDHCTLVNFPNFFFRDGPSVQFSDNVSIDGESFSGPLNITLRNSIIWGTQRDELLISDAGFGVTKNFVTGIVRSTLPVNGHFTSQEFNFPGFINPQLFDYRLDSMAFARDRGTIIGIMDDLNGHFRDVKPDFGAYEYFQE
jgi:hypothetical protein